MVYTGKRWSEQERELVETLPSDGVTGQWRFSKSEKGYVNREIFLDVLRDLADRHPQEDPGQHSARGSQ